MKKEILIVDDDPVELKLISSRLEKEGYQTRQAQNGKLGLEALSHQQPDLIILDIEMPEMNGYTFILEMKKIEEFKSIPVVVLTSHQENRPIFARQGVLHYLVKPVSFEELLPMLQTLLSAGHS